MVQMKLIVRRERKKSGVSIQCELEVWKTNRATVTPEHSGLRAIDSEMLSFPVPVGFTDMFSMCETLLASLMHSVFVLYVIAQD